MVDRLFCCSSFLAFRFVEKPGIDFSDRLNYRYPNPISSDGRLLVNSASDIDKAIRSQVADKKKEYKRIGLLLSGGMDSGILASYLPGMDAYTFRFLGGDFQAEELRRAEEIARVNNMRLHYVDIDWETVARFVEPVMISKGGPVHSIEPQICQAALQAKADGIDLMIIGDAADYVFGGMDKLLSQDWLFDDFVNRFIYIDPADVLREPVDVGYVFERYKLGNDEIDFVKIVEEVATQESYGSYENAFFTAKLEYFDPYEILKMAGPLDLEMNRKHSKYLIRELYNMKYPEIPIPEKNPMPRPVDTYFSTWNGPTRTEFRSDIDIEKYNGNQRWLMWCLEYFLNLVDEM